MKNLIIILCCLFILACNKQEEIDKRSTNEKKLAKFERFVEDTLKLGWYYHYDTNDKLISITDIHGEKLLSINSINDTTEEILYYWYNNGEKKVGNLRADYKNNKLLRLYEFNKLTNEIRELEYVYNYENDILSTIKSLESYYYFYIEFVNQINFIYQNNNLIQYSTTFKQYFPFGGTEKFDTMINKIVYSNIPYTKFIPFQYDNIIGQIRVGNQDVLINPFYILGINNITSFPKSSNLVSSFEYLNTTGGKNTTLINYQVENDTVKRIYIYDSNYWKLTWE